jgi:hypothetical protein
MFEDREADPTPLSVVWDAARRAQVKIYTKKLDSGMYRTCHEPMLASMSMQKAILHDICGI